MKKLLVVEDEPGVIGPLESYVKEEMPDFKFFKAFSGEEGVRIVETEHPDILILDMKLDPFMDGLEVLRRIHHEISHMAVIVFTGFVDPAMETEAKKLGVDAYLEKPVNLEELLETVHRVLERRQAKGADPKPKNEEGKR